MYKMNIPLNLNLYPRHTYFHPSRIQYTQHSILLPLLPNKSTPKILWPLNPDPFGSSQRRTQKRVNFEKHWTISLSVTSFRQQLKMLLALVLSVHPPVARGHGGVRWTRGGGKWNECRSKCGAPRRITQKLLNSVWLDRHRNQSRTLLHPLFIPLHPSASPHPFQLCRRYTFCGQITRVVCFCVTVSKVSFLH